MASVWSARSFCTLHASNASKWCATGGSGGRSCTIFVDGPGEPRESGSAVESQVPTSANTLAKRGGESQNSVRKPRLPRIPNYYNERRAWASGRQLVAGVDEAGRGAWAGPVVAAALILPAEAERRRALWRSFSLRQITINDSKQMRARDREAVVRILNDFEIPNAVAGVSSGDIDSRGVGYANALALRSAVLRLRPPPDFVLSDAFDLPDYEGPQIALVKGDCRSRTIALASIVAKVHRDALLVELDSAYPEYGFARHKGYGTSEHRYMLERFGPCPAHRRSFAPVREVVCNSRDE